MRWNWKGTIALVLGMLAAGVAVGTAQAPDYLILDGEKSSLNTNPLQGWLETHPGLLPRDGIESSNNWRGYVATWELAEGKLWLRKVEIEYMLSKEDEDFRSEVRDVTAKLFPAGGAIAADWYSGTLIVPHGKLVEYVHMGYGSTFEKYSVISVRQGVVKERLELDAKAYMELRRERFKAFQKTDTYKKALAETRGDGMDDKQVIQFLFEFYSEEYMSAD
jgi:hypothetical protein